MELISEIRKYYSFNRIKAVGEPNKMTLVVNNKAFNKRKI